MPKPLTADEAKTLARMVQEGRLAGADRAAALSALRDFETQGSPPSTSVAEKPKGFFDRVLYSDVLKTIGEGRMAQAGAERAAAQQQAAGAVRALAGPGQAITAAGEALGVPGADLQNYNRATEGLLRDIRGGSNEAGAGERIAELGTSLLLPSPTKVTGFLKQARQVAGLSALASASTLTDSDTVAEKAGSAVLGTLVGSAVTGTVAATVTGVKNLPNWYIRYMANNPDKVPAETRAKLLAEIPELRDQLTLGQQTGSTALRATEAQAAGNYAQRQYRTQAEIVKAKIEAIAKQFGKALSPEEAALRGQAAAQKELSRITSLRKAEWEGAINAAQASVTAEKISEAGVEGAAQRLLPAENLASTLIETAQSFQQPLSAYNSDIQQLLKEARVFKGQVSVETFLKALKASNGGQFAVLSGNVSPEAQRAAGSATRRAMFDAIDQMEGSEAANWLKVARQGYRERSLQKAQYEKSLVARTLGLKDRVPDAESAFRSFRSAGPTEQARMREVLSAHDPELLNNMRRLDFDLALQQATSQRADAGASTFSIDKFVDEFSKGDRLRLSGLYTEAQRKQLQDVVSGLRLIVGDKRVGRVSGDLASAAATAAGSAVAPVQSAPFLARQLMRSGRFMDQRLFTPEGRKIVAQAAISPGNPQAAANLARLTNYVLNSPQGSDE